MEVFLAHMKMRPCDTTFEEERDNALFQALPATGPRHCAVAKTGKKSAKTSTPAKAGELRLSSDSHPESVSRTFNPQFSQWLESIQTAG